MTTLTIDLPDKVAKEAKEAGLLTSEALSQLLYEAVRQQTGQKLISEAAKLHSLNIKPMTDEQIVAEVKAVRAERHLRRSSSDNASDS